MKGKMEISEHPQQLLERTLAYARNKNYTGYDYWDGMSSRLLQSVPFDNKWLNIAVQESAKRAPINIRPLLLIPERRSFMGCGLFTMANLTMYEQTGDELYLKEAQSLVEWLLEHRNDDPFGWDHNHAIQTLDRKIERNETSSVVTTLFVLMAILRLAEYYGTEGYTLIREQALPFLFDELGYIELDTGAAIKYRPGDSDDVRVLNANALGARLLLELYSEFQDEQYLDRSESILDYVVSRRTSIGGWKYTDPPSASHLSMDNHHNGFIIESLLRYEQITESDRYSEAIEKSLSFYKETLFTTEGVPNWDEKNEYPRDIHASAQGIITFSEAGDTEFARKVLEWTVNNFYDSDGRFFYRKQKYYTKRFTLMRWCQAWMAYALSVFLNQAD